MPGALLHHVYPGGRPVGGLVREEGRVLCDRAVERDWRAASTGRMAGLEASILEGFEYLKAPHHCHALHECSACRWWTGTAFWRQRGQDTQRDPSARNPEDGESAGARTRRLLVQNFRERAPGGAALALCAWAGVDPF